MGKDAVASVACLEKNLPSLTSHYAFDKSLWNALKTTNSVERINKEFKRRSKSMDSMGELRVRTLQAFTAMRLELGWRQRSVDTFDKQIGIRLKNAGVVIDLQPTDEVVH